MTDLQAETARLLALRKRMHLRLPLSRKDTWALFDHIETQATQIDALTEERDRFEAALGRACMVGGTTYLIERAEAAEAKVGRLAQNIETIAELNMTGADENGHCWTHSELIEQEVIEARGLIGGGNG